MKVGIVGSAGRAVAWEKHLAGHPFVSEVIIAADLEKIGEVDACLLLRDDTDEFGDVLTSIKMGYHTFLISKLPTATSEIEKLFYASEEANVRLQFSHWPTLAPASQWAAQMITKPSFIQVIREVSHSNFLESGLSLRSFWVDELAYCLKYINGSVHKINFNAGKLSKGRPLAIHLMLQFDSGATANIYVNGCSHHDLHMRYISDQNMLIDCQVEEQQIRIGRRHENGHLYFERKKFDATLAAEQATIHFLKAIQLKKPTLYNGYDLFRLAQILERINMQDL